MYVRISALAALTFFAASSTAHALETDRQTVPAENSICQQTPRFFPEKGSDTVVLLQDFQYCIDHKNKYDIITIPRGFVTDFASIPDIWFTLRGKRSSRLNGFRRHLDRAAIVHDYLYWTGTNLEDRTSTDHGCTKQQADAILRRSLQTRGQFSRGLFAEAVLFLTGEEAWNENQKHYTNQNRLRVLSDRSVTQFILRQNWASQTPTVFSVKGRRTAHDRTYGWQECERWV